MKIIDLLKRYNFPPEAVDTFAQYGIQELFPPQRAAIEAGALDGKNLLLSVPTAAGKTFVAELAMIKAILEQRGRCLYIVPLKALANEKYEDFKKRYSPWGVKIGLATGDVENPSLYLSGYHILVATTEKVDSLLRSRSDWLINHLKVVVLDEIHFLNDGSRGPTLEILTARLKQLNTQTQILALSATVKNAEELAGWLNAGLVRSEWRPIPLKEGIYFDDKIHFQSGPKLALNEPCADSLNKLVVNTLNGRGQVLVFVNSRRSAQTAARQVSADTAPFLTEEEKTCLADIALQLAGSASDSTKMCRLLAESVRSGVAFHHAGLKLTQRKLIEQHFRGNLIKVICSTPTLAAGVNLPARRVILRDFKRFEGGLGSSFIPASEYKQCAGRAGRPHYDEYGEAVIMAKTQNSIKNLFERYIQADPEPVVSKLGSEQALRFHILAAIAGGYVYDVNDTFKFISHTFLAYQKNTKNLIETISDIFDFLHEEEFIERQGFRFFATPFGQYTSRLYLDPISSIIIRDGLDTINDGKSFSTVGLLHLVCCCPDIPLLRFIHSELEAIQEFAATYEDELILTPKDCPLLDDFMHSLSIMKTAMMLSHWVEEDREEKLCDQFNIGPGDIYRHIEASRWLLHSGMVFSDLFEYRKLTSLLSHLKNRVQYGVKEELTELTKIRNIGRVRARNLFDGGIKHPADLKHTDIEHLARIKQIGKALAEELVKHAVH